jgi:superfamily II DNA or RNA helicase
VQLPLRDYQHEALAALDNYWQNGHFTRLAVILPTGSGKTVIFSELSRRAHARGMRPLILVHRDELVRQAADKIRSAMPNSSVGIVKAEHNDVSSDVIVASVQTLARERRRNQLSNIGTIVVDEAHHALAPSYVKILDHFGAFSDNGRRIPTSGWTATLARGDGKGLGDVWEEVVYERDILWMIDHGYLVDVKGKQVTVDGLDLATVARTRGDYQDGALGDALLSVGAGEHIADAYAEHAKDRQGVLFAPTVASAKAMAADLNTAGISTETVVGVTDLEDRMDIYERFRKGETQVLSNCMVLTEGWDMPQVSCAVIARPTSSASLYIQMVGRILRPWPGKQDALVLDVVGVAGKHKLATLKDLTRSEVQPEESETLREARERRDREAGRKGAASGVIQSKDIDLFGRSKSSWLQTMAGVWFIPTRDKLFFLWPQLNGLFKVGACSNRTTRDGQWLVEDTTLDYGMAWAEQAAEKADASIARRDAGWRKRKQGASPQQLDLCRRLGIAVPWGATKGEVSDLLSVHFASRLLDPGSRKR